MKLAIIGNNPAAIESAFHFHKLGASVTLFYNDDLDPYFYHKELLDKYPTLWSPLTFTSWNEKLNEQLNELKEIQIVKSNLVDRVQKCFLAPKESVAGKSRLADLFRVIYIEDPKEILEQQKSNNPQAFSGVSDDVMESLKHQMEGYEDFDMIVDVSYFNTSKKWMGTGEMVLGEKALKSFGQIQYGYEAISQIGQVDITGYMELAIIGSGQMAAAALLEVSELLIENKIRLFVITHEEDPFDEVLKENNHLSEMLKISLDKLEANYQLEVNEFVTKKKEWDALETYVKVKIPKPVEPIPAVVYFSGHNITAVDRLVDQQKFFLTCEMPKFRVARKQKENAQIELKTIGVDHLFVVNGRESDFEKYKSLNITSGPIHAEAGFYSIDNLSISEQLNQITENVMSFFKQV
jgi:hypothetical protein